VAHIVLKDPTCSSQHAVIQYRKRLKTIELSAEEQTLRGRFEAFIQEFVTVPYIMDLESTNGTVLNGEKIEAAKYYELRPKDVLRFGLSTIDYVLMRKG
jgi:smad nuclear-interacting protein 1